MSVVWPIASVTLQGLLGRRRLILLILLAGLPVLLALLIQSGGSMETSSTEPRTIVAQVIDGLVVRVVLPLIALVIGTAAIGSEVDDGTVVYLLTKPVARWQILLAKLLVAAGLSAALAGTSAIVTALILGLPEGLGQLAIAYGIAVAVGAVVYSATFLTLSILTTRALFFGLAYATIWEALLASLFAGTRLFSIHEYTMGLAAALAGPGGLGLPVDLEPSTAVLGCVLVVAVAFALGTDRLAAMEIRSAE